MSFEVAVVVCAHDEARWNDLETAIESLHRQELPAAEIVVVIDHNLPLLERARERFADETVVPNAGRPGLGEARNTGIRSSRSPIVAFLDDDAVAAHDWLVQLTLPYADAAVAGTGGSITARWVDGRPRWFPREFDWVVGCSYRGMPETISEVRNLLGCNMSFRRDALEDLGHFQLGYGCDETEFCIRLRQVWPWKRLIYAPEASVSHRVPAARGRPAYFARRCWFEGGSKAVVSKLVGRGDGLATETRYSLQVLPRGVIDGVAAFLFHRDTAGIARAGAIVAGLVITTAGYFAGLLSATRAARRRGWSGGRLVRSDLVGRTSVSRAGRTVTGVTGS
jgi:glucosyl-dolichyl phosphate glucuronosyltransferase